MFKFFKRKQSLPDKRDEETVYREEGQPILEAVTQVMICGSWDELLAVFTRYSGKLRSPEVDKVVEALGETFKDDAYTAPLIKERAELLALHRNNGIRAILQHPAMRLKEPTDTLRLFARIGKLKSVAEAESAGPDLAKFFQSR